MMPPKADQIPTDEPYWRRGRSPLLQCGEEVTQKT